MRRIKMDGMLYHVALIREATTPLEIMLNVDFLTDIFEKTEVKKEVLEAYGRNAQVESNFHRTNPYINDNALQMHRLWNILQG